MPNVKRVDGGTVKVQVGRPATPLKIPGLQTTPVLSFLVSKLLGKELQAGNSCLEKSLRKIRIIPERSRQRNFIY